MSRLLRIVLILLLMTSAGWCQTDPEGRALAWQLYEAHEAGAQSQFDALFMRDQNLTRRAFLSTMEYATEIYQQDMEGASEALQFANHLADLIGRRLGDHIPSGLLRRLMNKDTSAMADFARYATELYPGYASGTASYGPGGTPGYGPGGTPGYAPGGNPGYGPGGTPGYAPGGNPGYGPGGNPGYAPGGTPGYGPGGNPGYGPGGNPGYGPGGNPGYGPGGAPGYGPGASPYGPGGAPDYGPGTSPYGPGATPGSGPGGMPTYPTNDPLRPTGTTGGPPRDGQR